MLYASICIIKKKGAAVPKQSAEYGGIDGLPFPFVICFVFIVLLDVNFCRGVMECAQEMGIKTSCRSTVDSWKVLRRPETD